MIPAAETEKGKRMRGTDGVEKNLDEEGGEEDMVSAKAKTKNVQKFTVWVTTVLCPNLPTCSGIVMSAFAGQRNCTINRAVAIPLPPNLHTCLWQWDSNIILTAWSTNLLSTYCPPKTKEHNWLTIKMSVMPFCHGFCAPSSQIFFLHVSLHDKCVFL